MMIQSQKLTKQFRIWEKEPGFIGALKSFVKRRHKTITGVSSFDLEVEPGEMIGLLGPNGAGKTTLMKMFTGIIVPSKGSLTIAGYQPWERNIAFRRKIALVMGQKSQLWWDIPAMDSFELLRNYYEIDDRAFKKRLGHLTSVLSVNHKLNTQLRKLSLGERMKMELIASLLHEPDIVFLDEPTIGLDLVAQKNVREFLKDWQETHGTTMVLTSHYMADVQALCSRITLILEGEKRFDGPITDFEKLLGKEKMASLTFSSPVQPDSSFWQDLDPRWSENNHKVDIKIPEKEFRNIAMNILKSFPVVDFSTEEMPIERVLNSLLMNPDLIKPLGSEE